jgi:valyl-tRNA synthetase
VERTTTRLSDKRFTENAPAEVIEQTRKQLHQAQETLKKLSDYLAVLQTM